MITTPFTKLVGSPNAHPEYVHALLVANAEDTVLTQARRCRCRAFRSSRRIVRQPARRGENVACSCPVIPAQGGA
jgi:hypothetical protein